MVDNPFRLGQRPAGFRLFVSDFAVTFVAIVATLVLWNWAKCDNIYQMFVLLPLVLWGHFFLFCNVFRVSRHWELIWGTIFATIYGYQGILFLVGRSFADT